MPETLQALILFAAFIVPGFLLQRGYVRARVHGPAETDLHGVAAAVVWSLVVLAVAWWFGGESVVRWIHAGTLDQHLRHTYWLCLALLLIPYPVGLLGGVLTYQGARAAMRVRGRKAEPGTMWDVLFAGLDALGFFGAPTVWDGVWDRFLPRRTYLRVRTKSGQEIVGAFEYGSWVGLSPEPRQLFISTVYREDPPGSHTWKPVPRLEGVFIDAAEIETIEFAR